MQTQDGYISFTINTDAQVRAFLQATGRHALLDDPRFVTVAARAKYVAEWFAVRGAPLTDKTTAEWLAIFRAADLAAMPCHTLQTLPQDPHLQAVGLLDLESHPTEGRTAVIRPSIRIDDDYPAAGTPAAPRGWDTPNLLQELGYTSAEIETFHEQGATYTYESHES